MEPLKSNNLLKLYVESKFSGFIKCLCHWQGHGFFALSDYELNSLKCEKWEFYAQNILIIFDKNAIGLFQEWQSTQNENSCCAKWLRVMFCHLNDKSSENFYIEWNFAKKNVVSVRRNHCNRTKGDKGFTL